MERRFGPQYRTTAVDRNVRMLGRGSNFNSLAGEVPVASSSRQSCTRPTGQGQSMLMPMSSAIAGFSGPPLLSVQAPQSDARQPSLSEGHRSLMDLDNDVLESYATIDGVMGSVDIRQQQCSTAVNNFVEVTQEINDRTVYQNLPRPEHDDFASFGTQYVPLEDTNHRLTRNFTMNPLHRHSACFGPVNEMPHTQQFSYNAISGCQNTGRALNSSLSKTDRTVITELLKNVRAVNGSDEKELLLFLKELSPLFEVSPHCSAEIIKLLLPKVGEPLFKLWLQAVSVGADWNVLHEEILSRFFPALRRREIEASELDRPQRPGENFSEYCENIIATAFALKTRLSESEVVEIVLNKCEPTTKYHFAFIDRPQNIFELRSLAHKVSSSMQAEKRYFGGTRNPVQYNVGNASRENPSRFRTDNYPSNRRAVGFRNTERKVFVCYKCGQEGHIARECKVHLNRK